jgi:nucleoside-diphosphate-sugar epimerase
MHRRASSIARSEGGHDGLFGFAGAADPSASHAVRGTCGMTEDRPLIVVLGASGLVGSAVTAALARRPVRLRAVARRPSVVPGGPAGVEVRTADLTVSGELAAMVDGAAAVVDLIQYGGGWRAVDADPAESERVNVGVMADLVEILGKNGGPEPPLVVYAGAASQIGLPPERPIDGSEPDRPLTLYDRQKLAAETTLRTATTDLAVRGITLRLPTVFGLGPPETVSDRGIVMSMVRRALAGEPITMWHDGTVRRDVVHVDDIADAFLAALDHPDDLVGGHWPLGAGRGDMLGDVFREIADIVAARTGRPPVPVISVEPPADSPVTDFRSLTIDPSRFRSITGWRVRVPLSQALDRTVATLVDGR